MERKPLFTEEEVNQMYDSAYNQGIDSAIKFVESQRVLYNTINPKGEGASVLWAIVGSLEHFKRHIKDELKKQDHQ